MPEDAVLASVGIVKCSPDRGLLVSESMLLALEELIQACCGEWCALGEVGGV